MAKSSSLTYALGDKHPMNATSHIASQDMPLDVKPNHNTHPITHTVTTHLVQCEEGFILQGFQVDLEQTSQVLHAKNTEDGQQPGIERQ